LTRRYYGFQIKLVFDETTGLSDIEIYDCNNGETVVESENGGLEQRLSSGAGASGDCLSQVCRGQGFEFCGFVGMEWGERVVLPRRDEFCKPAPNTASQVDAMGSGDKRVIGLHIAVQA
jgi:hypothetical protein